MPVLNLVGAVLRGSIGRVIAVLRDRLLLLSLLVERFVLTLINEDYYYYYVIAIYKSTFTYFTLLTSF